ncbi:MAG: DUF2357 domain-containing protein [Clostridia bacterium]|nr:DUF2357 domain-containing protein [Clostridia bacterium]
MDDKIQDDNVLQTEDKFLQTFVDKMQAEETSCSKVHNAVISGGNKVAYNNVQEIIAVEDDWINIIENGIFNIESIVRNPRKFIVEEENIVEVGRAKRVNSKTVRHLSSNTQYIQSIDDDGNVTPSKVLVAELQEDVAIYENRFVCSLVDRLVTFVEQRYRDLVHKLNVFDNTQLCYHSDFKLGRSAFSCDFQVKVKEPPRDRELAAKNEETLHRLENIRARLVSLQNTQLMKFLHTKKPVRPPIQKTNMLRMSVDYSACYKLWLYISAYKFAGYSVEVREKNLPVEGDYYDDLTALAALSVQTMLNDGLLRRSYYDRLKGREPVIKKYKVLTKIDFETTFGKDEKSEGGAELINEFYFNKMRRELVKATKRGAITDEKEVSVTFRRFYRAIQAINEEMYKDVIDANLPELGGRTPLQKKQAAVKRQKQVLRRRHQLSMLERKQLEKCLHAESRELLKLEKLQAELDKERDRRKSKAERDKAKKEKLKRIAQKQQQAEINAASYERGLRGEIAVREAEKEEEKRQKREEAAMRRELKRYEELKKKYGGEDEDMILAEDKSGSRINGDEE